MSEIAFAGFVKRVAISFEPNVDSGELEQIVTLDAENIDSACCVVCRTSAREPMPPPGAQMQLYMDRSGSRHLAVAFDGVLRYDWRVENASIDRSFDATQVVTLPECPDSLRRDAESGAEALGVKLAWWPGKVDVQTARGTIRKELDIPGMIEPSLGWRKLLTELGLIA